MNNTSQFVVRVVLIAAILIVTDAFLRNFFDFAPEESFLLVVGSYAFIVIVIPVAVVLFWSAAGVHISKDEVYSCLYMNRWLTLVEIRHEIKKRMRLGFFQTASPMMLIRHLNTLLQEELIEARYRMVGVFRVYEFRLKWSE